MRKERISSLISYRPRTKRSTKPATGPLAAREPDIILATGPEIALKSALAATRTLPIVMIAIGTGVSLLTTTLAPKRLEILREVVPKASVIGVLLNPNSAGAQPQLEDVEKAARAIDQQMRILRASGERDFETAFAAMVQMRIGALIVGADPFFSSRRDQLVALAARDRIPAIYEWREFAEAGGLMSYGSDLADGYRQVGLYAGRILKGEKPADLPVEQATKIEFVINLKTAEPLGLTAPATLRAFANEVIE